MSNQISPAPVFATLSPVAQRVLLAVERIPKGKVSTYGAVATASGTSARAVGGILHRNPSPDRFPCHRVVHADGSLATGFAFGGLDVQRQLLAAEGVMFDQEGNVSIAHFWNN